MIVFCAGFRKDRRVMKTNSLVVVVFFSRHSTWLLHKTKNRYSQTFGLRLLYINDKWIHTWYFSIAYKLGGRCLGLFVSVSKKAPVKHNQKLTWTKTKIAARQRQANVEWAQFFIVSKMLVISCNPYFIAQFLFQHLSPPYFNFSSEKRLRIYYIPYAGHCTAKFENVVLKI